MSVKDGPPYNWSSPPRPMMASGTVLYAPTRSTSTMSLPSPASMKTNVNVPAQFTFVVSVGTG